MPFHFRGVSINALCRRSSAAGSPPSKRAVGQDLFDRLGGAQNQLFVADKVCSFFSCPPAAQQLLRFTPQPGNVLLLAAHLVSVKSKRPALRVERANRAEHV